MKVCGTCGKSGSDHKFVLPRTGRNVKRHKCKECTKKVNHAYYLANKHSIATKTQRYAQQHPDTYRKAALRYYHRNKTSCRASNRRWIKRNLNKLCKRMKERYASDIHFNLKARLRSRIHSALKRQGTYKNNSTMALVGCGKAALKSHIESLFVAGMSWDNKGAWHIDHKIPCASFDLTDHAQQMKCFHYTNLQPLWGRDNYSKGARL